jgi:hypothetical protein
LRRKVTKANLEGAKIDGAHFDRLFNGGDKSLYEGGSMEIAAYRDEKTRRGEPLCSPSFVEQVLKTVRESGEAHTLGDSIAVTWLSEEGPPVKAMLKKSKSGDVEIVLDEIVWWAGQARDNGVKLQIEKDERGALIYWGGKFTFLLTRQSRNQFTLYSSV